MPAEVIAITLPMPFKVGRVNCYLLETGEGRILIDTGSSNSRPALEQRLIDAGCRPGALHLIILTHGDFDHTGNAAYLRAQFGAPIAMHAGDLAMVRDGDMFAHRSTGNAVLRRLAPLLFGRSNRFKPDITLRDGDSLAVYGLDAEVLSLPGHSSGSIGVLTADGDLFCGDLLENLSRPRLNSIMDDSIAASASLDRLLALDNMTVYPGHGGPFRLDQLAASIRPVP
jgi:glyoxylase-like metal-dependent hydrolase (beta-lactamase superfamily II)